MTDIDIPYDSIDKPKTSNSSEFVSHVKVLLWKQYLTHARSKKSIICIAISPLILCLLLYLIQVTVTDGLKYENPNPPVIPAGNFEACTPLRGFNNCTSIGYGLFGNTSAPWIDHVIDYIALQTGLQKGTDIAQVYQGTNYTEFNNYFANNPGQVMIGLLFCTAQNVSKSLPYIDNCQALTDPITNISYQLTPYLIVYNHTLISSDYQSNPQLPFPTYPTALQLKILVDNGIVDFFNDQGVTDKTYINVLTESFPQTEFRFFSGFDIVDSQGGIYFFIAPLIVFIVLLNEITTEKEKKLRQGLSVVGVSHFTYWIHWVALAVVYALIVSLSLIASGSLLGFKVFTQAPFLVHLVLFFSFTFAMELFAFFVYTLVPTVKMANTVGYAILLLGIVMQLFLSNPTILQYLYDTTNAAIYKVVIGVFLFYPAFSFTVIYTDVMMLAGDTFSYSEGRWVNGPGYTWSDFTNSHTGQIIGGDTYNYPSSLYYLMWLYIDMAIFVILVFYADHVVSHNRGSGLSPWFLFSKNYWRSVRGKSRSRKQVDADDKPSDDSESETHENIDTVGREREKVLRHINNGVSPKGIRIQNLSKIYKQNSCGCKSRNDVKALSNIYLEVSEGELLGLLGHNGAGKTTLINILTGVLGGFDGQVIINEYDIVQERDEVKKVVGVCPQFDILWHELTAKEHLYMFARIKQIPKNETDKHIKAALEEVNLTKVGDVWAGTFSGGMKRRLSMAIASMGNPKIIFLDEPTTGMDPKNRRQVWELIKNLKKNRVVILTTHAMEEADALSDRIAVIVDGQFKCIGNSLFLKNNFGEGYRLTLVVDPQNVSTVKSLMKQKIPSVKVIDESGGSIMFSVPVVKIQELQAFFRIIENKDQDEISNQIRALTNDWGLSNTTLEEVFMKVTGKKEKKQD